MPNEPIRSWRMNGIVSANREKLFMETETTGSFRVGARSYRDVNMSSRQVIVVYDPIPVEEGGFSVGAIFFTGEWEEMKKMEVISIGFQVRLPSGKTETIDNA